MSRVALVKVGERLAYEAKKFDSFTGLDIKCGFEPTRAEALAIADLVEKARALVDSRAALKAWFTNLKVPHYHEQYKPLGDAVTATENALAALFEEGR